MKKIYKKGFTRTNFLLKNLRGFTLIELLIVIALLGALAVGLLAALDPFEQLKKGTDTGIRNTVSEFQGAVIRYYAIKNRLPWCDEDGNCQTITSAKLGSDTNLVAAITDIIAAGELKSDFTTLATTTKLNEIYVTADNSNLIVNVCYKPTSKSFQVDPNTKFDIKGDDSGANSCKSQQGSDSCYWCVK